MNTIKIFLYKRVGSAVSNAVQVFVDEIKASGVIQRLRLKVYVNIDLFEL